jgi:hypothetical protein
MLILHLDDRRLLLQGLKRCVSSRFVGCNYQCVLHPNSALEFFQQSMERGVRIDLIITDYTHLGLNGYRQQVILADDNLVNRFIDDV